MKALAPVTLVALLALHAGTASAQSRFSASPAATQKEASSQAASAFPAGARIAYVDLDRVAAVSAEGKAVNAKLNELRAKKSAEVEARSKQVQELQHQLTQSAAVLSELARARLQREFQRAQVDFQRFSEDAQAEIREAQEDALQAFSAKLFPVIGEVAREKQLWAVFGSQSGLLWHDPATDLSDEVARRLDAATPR
jgi:outer membrane protein